mgnify:FL=1
MADIAIGLELLSGAKVHIDSGRKGILEAVACQIHSHKLAAGTEKNLPREVRQWCGILHCFCFVENHRNGSKELTREALETELYNVLARLFPSDASL